MNTCRRLNFIAAQRDRHPPKYEAFDNYYLLLLKGLSKASTGIDFETLQISMLVSERFFITRHNDESRQTGGRLAATRPEQRSTGSFDNVQNATARHVKVIQLSRADFQPAAAQ
jgi:Mg2+ and Co2+ transporter CorA